MRVRKFQADTMREALLQVKEELGPDALILRSQKVRGSFLGGGERWEVTAGLEDRFYERPGEGTETVAPPPGYGPGSRRAAAPASVPREEPPAPVEERTALSRDEFRALQDGLESVRRATEAPTQAIAAVKAEMGQLRSVVSALAEHWKDQSAVPVSAPLLPLFQSLIAADMAEDLAREACDQASHDAAEAGVSDPLGTRRVLERALASRLPCSPLRFARGRNASKILFAGPTGVGKTTTVMKLAVRLSREEGLKVGIVGCDSYRIGAQEQIRTFCDVAGIELRTVFTDADLDTALGDLAGCDVLLVDTAGRSPANQVHFLELSTLVDRIRPDELVLVQSATTRLRDLSASVRAYHDLRPSRLVFTKIDETDGHGALCTLVARSRIPVAALCFGQEIPEHMAEASSEDLARMVLGEEDAIPA